jgi:hypothetical protein
VKCVRYSDIYIPLHRMKKPSVTVMFQAYIWKLPGFHLKGDTKPVTKQVHDSGNTVDLNF